MNALSSYHRHLMQQMECFREQMWTGSLHHKLIFSPFDQSKPSQWKESEAGSRLLTCSDFVIGFDGDGLCTIFDFHVDCCNILLLNGKRYAFFAHPGQVVTQFSSFASGLFAMRPFFVEQAIAGIFFGKARHSRAHMLNCLRHIPSLGVMSLPTRPMFVSYIS